MAIRLEIAPQPAAATPLTWPDGMSLGVADRSGEIHAELELNLGI